MMMLLGSLSTSQPESWGLPKTERCSLRTVRDLASGPAFGVSEHGEHGLKGIPDAAVYAATDVRTRPVTGPRATLCTRKPEVVGEGTAAVECRGRGLAS